ncbi:MAG: hypothetical protein KAJ86_01140 [Alphaproteobacteria bacterium]|nr:hypothetical protein [Alphaproteobacteria bacterium]
MCAVVAFALLTVVCFVSPTLATEVTDQVAQRAAINNGQLNSVANVADAVGLSVMSEENSFASAIATAMGDISVSSGIYNESSSEETYDLILSVTRKARVLSQAIIGIEKDFVYYVPLRELARILKFPTNANLSTQSANGYFFNEVNTYSIDLKNKTYSLKDTTFPLPENSFLIKDLGQNLGDIYVTVELINKIWNLDLNLNFSEQSIQIKTKRRLPFELELERQKNQKNLDKRKDKEDTNKLEYITNGYKLFGAQNFSIMDDLSWSNENNEIINNLTISGIGDALGASADYTIKTIQSKNNSFNVDDIRLRLTRRDFGTDKLLPFGLRLAQVGDISVSPSPLIGQIMSGRGMFISSKGSVNKQSFDEIVIEGTAQPGWEVELYLNRHLIDFGFVNKLGEYRFENVPLNYGGNKIKIILYGPQGQIEERHEDYRVKGNMLRPGETNFEAGILDFKKRFIEINDDPNSKKGIAKYLRINRGINSWATGYATATQSPSKENDTKYLSLGASFNALGGAGQIEAYKQIDGGTALDAKFARKFAGIRTNASMSFYNDFESKEANFGNNKKTFTGKFRALRHFILPFAQGSLDFNAQHTKYENNKNTTIIKSRQSLSRKKLNATNTVNTTFTNNKRKSSTGQFSLSAPFSDNWNLRSSLFYDIYPKSALDSTRIRLGYTDNDKFTSNLTFKQGIEDKDKTAITAAASYDFGTFFGGVDVNWSKNDGYDLLLRANTNFGSNEEKGSYKFTSSPDSQKSSIDAQIYNDINNDGEYSEIDEPIEGGRILINGSRKSDPSNANGYINISNVGIQGLAIITFDQNSSPNPFLASVKDGYKTVLRAGTKPFINMPLIMTGSIDGTIRFADGRSVPGMIIQLVDKHGQLVAESPTLSDGFYSFEFVKPGRYIVQVHASHRVFVPPRTVTVASDDLFAYGVDLQILEQAKEAPVTNNEGDGRVAHTYLPSVTGGMKKPVSMPSSDGVQAVVRAVRIGEHPHKVRLVLDLSEPARYQILKEQDGYIITIELPDVGFEATHNWLPNKHSIFSNCEINTLAGGGTQLRLTGKDKIDVFYNALLPSENGKPDRLYIDFIRVK